MLDHQKLILLNVQDDFNLFRKELQKTLNWINPEEFQSLYNWLEEVCNTRHLKIVQEVFTEEAA